MQRLTGRDMWDVEECQSPRMGSVILGVDGGASNTVCVCIPAAMPFNDPLPVLSRTIAGCSNHNSVGGNTTSTRSTIAAPCSAQVSCSGYGISAQALTAVVRAYDGRGPETVLTNNILDFLGLASPDELIGWTYEDQSWARIADLLPVVVESAESGDEVANKILHNSVGELASSVKAVVQRLDLGGEDGKHPFPLVMVGKVLEANKRWDIGKEVIDCVTKNYPGAYPIHPQVEPAVGAALLAWNAIAREIDGDIRTVQ